MYNFVIRFRRWLRDIIDPDELLQVAVNRGAEIGYLKDRIEDLETGEADIHRQDNTAMRMLQ